MDPEAKAASEPGIVITRSQVEQVLLADKGQEAQLKSWEVVPFTKKGDNYACIVTSVVVKYAFGSLNFETSYVVKQNARVPNGSMRAMMNVIFEKEIKFYTELLPKLNAQAESTGQPPLSFAQCFHSILDMGQEQIFFEDLRRKGYMMFDRRKGMDVPHATLVLKELARLHAASLLLQEKYPEPIEETHPYLLKDYFNFTDEAKAIMLPMLQQNFCTSIEMLDRVGGYESSKAWIESLKSELEDIFGDQLRNNKYDIICHGDCWNNNILFRYDEDGAPLGVMFVDLQLCRMASPATDLNYFLYTSLISDVRRPNLSGFLNTYCDSFKKMVDAARCPMPFTKEEIMREFRAKNKLGATFAMFSIPILLLEPEDIPDVQGDVEEIMKLIKEKSLSMLKSHPLVKPRFLSIFDEFIETGLIS